MNVQRSSTRTLERSNVRNEPDTRLHGRWLFLARAACVAAGVLSFGVFVSSVPATYASLFSLFCTGPTCNHPTQAYVQQLQALGISVQAYVIYYVVLDIVFVCSYFIVAIILFWRRSDDWMALFASLFLMTFAITFSSNTLVATPYWLFQFVNFLGSVSIVVFFYLFPTGRFVPRWTRWLSIGATLYWGFQYFWPPFPFNPYTNPIFVNIAFPIFVGAMVIAQVYRYLRVSNRVQRQQTKWVVFGVSIAIGGYFVLFYLSFVLLSTSAAESPLAHIISNIFNHLLLLLIPISIAFAILRSRLWDIDIIIHRTLVYSTLTVVLAVIYEVSVFTLQSLLSGLTFIRGNQLAIVASTFLIGGLFKPVHDRTRALIDRRFYRRKYDAAKTLVTFSTTIRDEVDLNQLSAKLVAVVDETMQPAHISMWLRPHNWEVKRTTRLLPHLDEEGGG
jgi:hypothetical protein